jgi:general secretion pathway protein F
MPAYQFTALEADGKTRKGIIEADTARGARSNLRAQSLIPLEVNAVVGDSNASSKSQSQGLFAPRRMMNNTALTIWTRQLAGLVGAGLPLERALTALVDESEGEAQRGVVAALRSEINGGASFATALAQHPREFSDIYCAVIGAGEQSGNLGEVLNKLADDLEEQQTLRAKLIGAALYPAIVTLIATVIVIFLVSYVVPQVASVFAGSKRALPFLTVAMLGISSFIRHWGWLLLLVLALLGALLRMALRVDAFRERFDAAWLELPLIGRLARGYNAARFSGTLAMLALAGVPILRGLQTAALTLSNRALRRDALEALVQVREGATLASALSKQGRFPSLLAMFARLGEQTGQLPKMLDHAAKQLGNDVQRRALSLATILEPLLIVVMGVMVLLIVLAVLLPIIQMNQFMK